jgi:hypothetical protein
LYEKLGFTVLKEYSGNDYYFMEKILKTYWLFPETMVYYYQKVREW